jgi:hypothetical protein
MPEFLLRQRREKQMKTIKDVVGRARRAAVALAVALLAGLTLAGAPSAFAAAGSHASCMGLEASNISPPGSSDEVPGGMPEFNAFIRANVPGPKGAVNRQIAKLHLGSHDACDEALG